MPSESSIIKLIRELAPCDHELVLIGIGDDTAAVQTQSPLLLTSDLLVERTHFDFQVHAPYDIGRKALAVNISDIAAMGGTPAYALLSLATNPSVNDQALRNFFNGFCDLARAYGISLIGGDTNTTRGPFVASVTLCGHPHFRQIVTRAGAKPGDLLLVTGPLGGSYESGKHLHFTPRVTDARMLLDRLAINAMMDISDGLGADLPKLCAESGVGAKIFAEALPISANVAPSLPLAERVRRALGDGEDFELLIALPRSALFLATSILPQLQVIGEITAVGTEQPFPLSLMINDTPNPWPKLGYEHQTS